MNVSNKEYLSKHGIEELEELIGVDVFHVFPRQGIVRSRIRSIKYTQKLEWFIHLESDHRISELGETIFFDFDEAKEYQYKQLEKYNENQRRRILKDDYIAAKREVDELERLLQKYPDEESRNNILPQNEWHKYFCTGCEENACKDGEYVDCQYMGEKWCMYL